MAARIVDFVDFEVWLAEYRDLHRAGGPGSGRFARTPRGRLDGLSCADFAVIDYTVGPWPLSASERDARVKILQGFQAAPTGLFDGDARPAPGTGASAGQGPPPGSGPGPATAGAMEDPFCRTGYFVAALELLGARPMHPIRAMDRLRSPSGMDEFLDGAGPSRPPLDSCRAAAVAGCFAVTGDVGPEWFERFLGRLAREADAGSGRRRKGRPPPDAGWLCAAFPMMTIHERFRAALPHPAAIVRTALALQRPDGLYDEAGPGWLELAAAFALERGLRQSGEARAKVLAACEKLLRASAERFADAEFRDAFADDPHRAAGAVSLFAVLAEALPGSIRSRRPLRLFTERHLFV